MQLRVPYFEVSPEPLKAMREVGAALAAGPLEQTLIELVYLRVSQINGCAFCLKKHAAALRKLAVPQAILDQLAGWHAAESFSARERAALDWAESLTVVAATHAPDTVFDRLRAHFDDREIADLTYAIANMNALNRLAIAMRQ